MSVQEIENAVQELRPDEFEAFRQWFAEFEAQAWDRQIAEDVTAGKLNDLADEALLDLREGRCTEL